MALSRVGIVCALASEARHLGRISLHNPVEALPDGSLVAVTGMGETAASRGTGSLIAAGATALASFGMAGGLDPVLGAGAILLPSEVLGPDGRHVATDAGWCERLSSAIRSHAACSAGTLLTTPRAVGSVTDKAHLFRTTGAAAVDMESLAVGELAARHQLPFIAVRVIVDSAEDALPSAVVAAADAEGHLQIGRLIGELARAPRQLVPLIRLARRYRAANRSLAAIARTGSLGMAPVPTLGNHTASTS